MQSRPYTQGATQQPVMAQQPFVHQIVQQPADFQQQSYAPNNIQSMNPVYTNNNQPPGMMHSYGMNTSVELPNTRDTIGLVSGSSIGMSADTSEQAPAPPESYYI